ncbi:PadR family transcriptional regulator [Fodinicola acaciae]|uniref:PadR family transcriptional regulator n=1 Tax=Fodinicola acaciae TaxID=2681555 RepID=UPI0013D481A9|nr:PadR family transcriptional regulator [Fodinicola acaciae]
MLSRTDRDVVALTVLALLMTGPKHTYEMHRMMIDTHKDFVTGLPRSMYHAVEKLQRDGLIDAVETRRDGPRPERTVYALTDAGRASLRERVGKLLRTPDADSTSFVAALSFVGCIPVPHAREALGERAAELQRAADAEAAALDEVGRTVPRLLLIELEYQLSKDRAEKAWVDGILADLDGGQLDWPDDPRQLIVELPLT